MNMQRVQGGGPVVPSSYGQLEVNKSTTGRIPNVIVLNPEKTPEVEPQRKRELTTEEGSDRSSYANNALQRVFPGAQMPAHDLSIISLKPPQEENVQSPSPEGRGSSSTSPQPVKPPPPAGRGSSSVSRGPPPPVRGRESIEAEAAARQEAARQEAARRVQLDSATRRGNQERKRFEKEYGPTPAARGPPPPPRGLPQAVSKARLDAAAAESARTAEKGKIREKESELMIKELGKKTSPSLQQTAAGQPKLASKGSASDIQQIRASLLRLSSSQKV